MQFIVVLLIIALNYVSSEEASCYLARIDAQQNDYIAFENQNSYTISKTQILKTWTDKDKITVTCDILDDAGNVQEEAVALCVTKPSTKDSNLLNIMNQALGIDNTGCPVQEQIIENPSPSFPCEFDFGSETGKLHLDYVVVQDMDVIFELTVSIVRAGDEDEKK